MRYLHKILTKYAFHMYLSHTQRTKFLKYFWIFYDQITTERTDIYMFKKSVFCPYLGQFLSDFENLWYRYDQKNEIFKLSTFTYWSDYYLKNRFLRPQSLSRPKLALIWLRGPKMPLKDWVTMIDLWLIVISIPCFQNKSACPPPPLNHPKNINKS